VSLSGRPLFDLPIGAFEVLHNGVGDLVLFVLGEGSAHAANQLHNPARSPITTERRRSSASAHMSKTIRTN
jgi:hypothetical protein